jgi:hypothetical protein
MMLTKNRQALSEFLVEFLRKEWEIAPYTNGVVFDTSLIYEFCFLRDESEIEIALYTYNVGKEHVLNFILEDGFVYCRSIRKGYTKDGDYQEVRFKLDYEEFKTKKLSKFEDLIEFISSDELARVLLHALKELQGEVN